MNYPVQFGLPQIVLIVVAVLALVLLVTSLVELRIVERVEDEVGTIRHRRRLRPRLRAGRAAGGVVLLLIAVFLLFITALIQTYLGLTGEVRAAHVRVTQFSNMPHSLAVDLTLYDDKGKVQSEQTYQVEGDMWVLQADIVELEHWVNVVGLHSGYKVTRLFGERQDGVSPSQHQIFLNGGDGGFFSDMHDHTWWIKPFVRSAYGNAVIDPPGDYDVYISQDAIKARPAS